MTPIPEEMLSVGARLAEWRKSHSRRSRLPEELWVAAVELAHRHGLYRTARALPIGYAGLRSRLQARTAESRSTTAAVARQPEFVEVRLSPVPTSSGHIEYLAAAFRATIGHAANQTDRRFLIERGHAKTARSFFEGAAFEKG